MDWLRLNPHDAIARWRRWERCWTSSRHGRPSSWDFAVKKPPQKIFFFSRILHILKLWLYIYIYYIQYIIHQKHHTKIVVKLFSLNRFDHFGGDYFIDAYIYIKQKQAYLTATRNTKKMSVQKFSTRSSTTDGKFHAADLGYTFDDTCNQWALWNLWTATYYSNEMFECSSKRIA